MSQLSPIIPYHRVNTLTGTRTARTLEDPKDIVRQIKKAKRPLFVLGPIATKVSLGDKLLIEYCIDIAKAGNIPICATATTKAKLLEYGVKPDSVYDTVEIINALKDPEWKGVKGEGNHDLVIFLGIRSDLANQGLSTLKHFAPHLSTLTLCKYYHPHADYSLPNIFKDEKWKAILDGVIENLKSEQQ
ncbi:MAG: CO dehydrogenase/acetyl-CoA synthase complex subunit epsilon [Desulfobacterota bacterium]|nr:CO dehydrogenase/acetyl-CoA synthase complex subunit epsilon [Thermodesulfobacteriota bacterium]MDW8002458.1 CO dehydrogenase/acetyl-CoA synthase complex subunit epsilon [Deltaproteobacteria bacterium]